MKGQRCQSEIAGYNLGSPNSVVRKQVNQSIEKYDKTFKIMNQSFVNNSKKFEKLKVFYNHN